MSGHSKTTSITLQDPDPAELWRLAPTVARILPAVEQFWRYADRDAAGHRRSDWLARIDASPSRGGRRR